MGASTNMRNTHNSSDYDRHLRRLIVTNVLSKVRVEPEEVHGHDFYIFSEAEVTSVTVGNDEEHIENFKEAVGQVPCTHSYQGPPPLTSLLGPEHQWRSERTPDRPLLNLLRSCLRFLKGGASPDEFDRKPKN